MESLNIKYLFPALASLDVGIFRLLFENHLNVEYQFRTS